MALTEKQKRFADEYLVDLNATQAAIRAGYSEKSAYSQGQRMLKNAEVQEHIQKIMADKDSALIASQDEILQTLTAILRREKKEIIVANQKIRKSYYDAEGRKCTEETDTPVLVAIDTKISDVNKAAELLGKRYGLYADNVKLDGALPVVIRDDIPETDE